VPTDIYKTLWTAGNVRCLFVTHVEEAMSSYRVQVAAVGDRTIWNEPVKTSEHGRRVGKWLWRRFGEAVAAL
jgi:hypothetical protein